MMTEDSPPRPARNIVFLAAACSALLGALAFFSSILVNTYIFAQWDLAFMQIASPADVVMSGLSVTMFTILTSFTLTILSSLGYWIGRKTGWWKFFLFLMGALVAAAGLVAIRFSGLDAALFLALCLLLSIPVSGCLLGSAANAGARFVLKAIALVVGLSATLTATATLFVAEIRATLANGYLHDSMSSLGRDQLSLCRADRVASARYFWIGERYIVLECHVRRGDDDTESEIIAVAQPAAAAIVPMGVRTQLNDNESAAVYPESAVILNDASAMENLADPVRNETESVTPDSTETNTMVPGL